MEVMSDKKLSIHSYDFGEDADIELPNDPAFDAWISGVAETVNAPTPTPRAEMWTDISSRVGAAKGKRRFRKSLFFLPAALAAALIVGVGVDRMVQQREVHVLPSAQDDKPVLGPS